MSDTSAWERMLTHLGVPYVLDAYVPLDTVFIFSLTNVKDAKDTMSEVTPNETEDSAEPVVQKFQFGLNDGPFTAQTIQKKCAKCNAVTSNMWFKITTAPMPGFEIDPLDLLKQAKRAILCQNCGNITVTN